jgi:hypothetical protein
MRCKGGVDEFLGYFSEQFSAAEMHFIKTGCVDTKCHYFMFYLYDLTSIILLREYNDTSRLQLEQVSISGALIDAHNDKSTGAVDEESILERFYVNWALKEALVKASGCGITGFDLHDVRTQYLNDDLISDTTRRFRKHTYVTQAEFEIIFDPAPNKNTIRSVHIADIKGTARVRIKGRLRPDWM